MMEHLLITVISLADISVLLLSVITLVNRMLPGGISDLRAFISATVWLSSLSFLYYLSLVSNCSFPLFLALFSGFAVLLLYFNLNAFRNLLTKKYPGIWGVESCLLWAVIFLTCIFFFYHGSKYGDDDAWAFWNRNARFLFDHHYWKNAFLDHNPLMHDDYPLMLPALVAFLWHIFGSCSFVIPAVFSLLCITGVELLLYYAVKNTAPHGAATGFAALFLLLLDVRFQEFDNAQYADMLLSLYMLLVIALNENIKRLPPASVFFLGFAGATCMWVKNEGILFCIIFSVVFIFNNRRRLRYLLGYVSGLIIPLLISGSFKLFYAPANDLIKAGESQFSRIISDFTDMHRYLTIIGALYHTLITYYWTLLVALILLIIFRIKSLGSSSFLVLILLFAGYLVVYITTPYDLNWHLATSLNRLIGQLYPSLIFLIVIAMDKNVPVASADLK